MLHLIINKFTVVMPIEICLNANNKREQLILEISSRGRIWEITWILLDMKNYINVVYINVYVWSIKISLLWKGNIDSIGKIFFRFLFPVNTI